MTEKQFPLVGVCCAAVLKVLHEYLSDELANVLTGEIAKEIDQEDE